MGILEKMDDALGKLIGSIQLTNKRVAALEADVASLRNNQHAQPAIAELFDRYLEDCDVSRNEQQAIQYFVDYVQQQQASAQ